MQVNKSGVQVQKLKDIIYLPPQWRVPAAIMLGLLCGLGGWLLYVSKGLTYLTSDSKTCVNCHVMNSQYATFNHDSHRERTNCVDCHLPHDTFAHFLAIKAKDGMKDTALYLLDQETNVAHATEATKAIIQQNCIRCHSELVDSMPWGKTALMQGHKGAGRYCWECHKDVPHGKVHGLSSVPDMELQLRSNPVPKWLQEQL